MALNGLKQTIGRVVMTDEIWLPVVGFEGLYEVSNYGSVRSLVRVAMANYGERKYGGKNIRPILRKADGYLVVNLYKDNKRSQKTLHVVVAEAFHFKAFPELECCHNNGIKADCRSENLRWGTRKENSKDKEIHGTKIEGSKSPNAKLNEEQVIEIRAAKGSKVEIAKAYGVSDQLIGKIKRREAWSHI